MFAEYEERVVKSFGITPSVFFKMLQTGNYSKTQIEQAIRVTRRAKYNQEISKSVPGFFLKALKEGFTDSKEEVEKGKKSPERSKESLLSELNALKEALSKQINERIRIITTQDATIIDKAIVALRSNPAITTLIELKEKEKGKELRIEDYRQNEQLRAMVIDNIVEQEKSAFRDIYEEFATPIRRLKAELNKK